MSGPYSTKLPGSTRSSRFSRAVRRPVVSFSDGLGAGGVERLGVARPCDRGPRSSRSAAIGGRAVRRAGRSVRAAVRPAQREDVRARWPWPRRRRRRATSRLRTTASTPARISCSIFIASSTTMASPAFTSDHLVPGATAYHHARERGRQRNRGSGTSRTLRDGVADRGEDLLGRGVVAGVVDMCDHVTSPSGRTTSAPPSWAALPTVRVWIVLLRTPVSAPLATTLGPNRSEHPGDLGTRGPVADAVLVGEHRELDTLPPAELGGVARRGLADQTRLTPAALKSPRARSNWTA